MDGTTREFSLDGSGVRLVLNKGADDLDVRDIDRFFEAYRRQAQGNTVAEDNHKTLRAAFDAGWIVNLTIVSGQISSAKEVDTIHPVWQARWAAQQIDAVIAKAREIPVPLSSPPPTT